jgi:hypothetical protein
MGRLLVKSVGKLSDDQSRDSGGRQADFEIFGFNRECIVGG